MPHPARSTDIGGDYPRGPFCCKRNDKSLWLFIHCAGWALGAPAADTGLLKLVRRTLAIYSRGKGPRIRLALPTAPTVRYHKLERGPVRDERFGLLVGGEAGGGVKATRAFARVCSSRGSPQMVASVPGGPRDTSRHQGWR